MVTETKSLYSCRANQSEHKYIKKSWKGSNRQAFHLRFPFVNIDVYFLLLLLLISHLMVWNQATHVQITALGGTAALTCRQTALATSMQNTNNFDALGGSVFHTQSPYSSSLQVYFQVSVFSPKKCLKRRACMEKKDAHHWLQVTEFTSL